MEDRYPGAEGFRISNSTLETFLRCNHLHWLRKESRRRRVTVPMAIGTGVAAAAKQDNLSRASGFQPLSTSELVDLAVEAYQEEVELYEVQNAAKFDIEQSRDDAADATRAYVRDIQPTIIRPILVEEAVIADLGDGLELAGTPDLIESGMVRDLKTGQPWTQTRVDRSRQLTAYDILYEAAYGVNPERVAIDSVSRPRGSRRGWSGATIWSSRTERDRLALIGTIGEVRKAMEAGCDLPAPEGAWWCAEAQCDQWDVCKLRPGA